MSKSSAARGKFAFETYQKCAGKPPKRWEDLPENEQDAWATVVFEIFNKIASREW